MDGQYAVFGYVYEGMDIVDQICKDVKVEDNNGTVKKENQPVIESIPCIIIFSSIIGLDGIFIAVPVADLSAFIITVLLLKNALKKEA